MRVATTVAGFSMTEADDLRKACSKKIRDMIQAQRIKFVEGTERQGYGRALGEAIFDKIEPFADYAFNKSHAYGYALVGYQNAWLKANYPVEYMAALLTSFKDDKDKAAVYLNEARQMGITIGVPDVNQSFAEYAPSLAAENTILFGMAAVRNVGEALVEKIVAEREAHGTFESVYDFVRRVDPVVLESSLDGVAHQSRRVRFIRRPSTGVPHEGRRDHRRHAQSSQGSLARDHHALCRLRGRKRRRRLGGDRGRHLGHGVRAVGQARLRARDARHLHLRSSAL